MPLRRDEREREIERGASALYVPHTHGGLRTLENSLYAQRRRDERLLFNLFLVLRYREDRFLRGESN